MSLFGLMPELIITDAQHVGHKPIEGTILGDKVLITTKCGVQISNCNITLGYKSGSKRCPKC
ncbi:MAG: hypothetical protein UV51_C0018G0008 [Candidatus Woesebacteria bacterium GW2011_GWC1_42_9]|nr:MAG: hypothetical protein UV51_C0018G0008 [Candidatus Woesebacteria bacterium GW2011_GWC1_42_9]